MFRFLVLAAALLCGARALDNGLARTPQMGYNSWYDLMGALTEANIKDTTDAMVESGLYALGYNYLNLDDDWATTRDSAGRLVADPTKWTNGSLATVAEYVHGKGMLFGTYTDRGTLTCGGRPAAQGHEAVDAQTYADWGVDYLKEDSCHAPGDHATAFAQYGAMRDALNATGRPILFSLCGWNDWYARPDPALNYTGGGSLGNSFRIGPDDTNWGGVLKNIDINAGLSEFAGPGGWNDPCLLLSTTYTGQLRVTERQSRAQFSMWAVMASPLLISGNVRNMSAYTLETYKNKEVIAVSQDALGRQGVRVVGGALSAPAGGGNTPAHTTAAACTAAGQPGQSGKWAFGSGAEAGYLINAATGKALNSDNCGQSLIYYAPVTSGGTCVGASGKQYDNLRFRLNGTALVSAMNGMCVTERASVSGQLLLEPCADGAAAQQWTLSAGGALKSAASGRCLDGAAAAAQSATNVWARPLASGAAAAVFLNNAATDVAIPCDFACFTAMGFKAGQKLAVRDLWAHAALPSQLTVGATMAPFVPSATGTAEGGATMFTFTSVA